LISFIIFSFVFLDFALFLFILLRARLPRAARDVAEKFEGVHLGELERRLTLLSKDNEVCLAWLAGALQRLRQQGQEKIVGYLEEVLEEVLFETNMPPRPGI
jgi:hypothetical protein